MYLLLSFSLFVCMCFYNEHLKQLHSHDIFCDISTCITAPLYTYIYMYWFLILYCYMDDPQMCFFYSSWIPCLSWKVKLPAVLQKNSSGPTNSLVFQHLSRIWTLSNNDYMILRSISSLWGQLRDSYTTITKGLNAHQCSRRKKKKDALRAWRWKLFEFEDQGKLNLFFLLQKKQKTAMDHPGNKTVLRIKYIYSLYIQLWSTFYIHFAVGLQQLIDKIDYYR